MNLKHLFSITVLALLSASLNAQIVLVREGKAQSRIVVDESNETDLQAAKLLQDFFNRISDTTLPIISKKTKTRKGDILIGDFQLPVNHINKNTITEEGFILTTNDKFIRIVGNVGKGSIYGAITLLEDYLEVRYLKANTCDIIKSKNIIIPEGINRLDNPSFRYRQTQAYSIEQDSLYKLWHRLENPQEVFADGLWVHTFNHILSADEFGKSHPEYFTYMNGQRHPGTVAQWCLTNDEVFDIVVHRLDSIFKRDPNKHIISVSQNDSQNYCQCDVCKKILDREGSPAGVNIYFMNKLAERFPDKEFSTLAYLYSVAAPKHIKPLPNVNIMLCNIECYREVSLTENKSGQEFVKEMEAWSKISNNIFVWDYGINFDNFVAPFPNFHILQPNMKLFKKNGATMHFSQIGGTKGGDFSELRSYVVSKLLWNVDVDVRTITQDFLTHYYGAAAPYIYDYIKLREGALQGSQIPLWIYDTPVTHKEGMLNKHMLKRYYELFDKAEAAVADNPTLLNRVKETKLPIQYSELEIIKSESEIDIESTLKKVKLFQKEAADQGVTVLNERLNLIPDYCELYVSRYLGTDKVSLARGAKVEYTLYPQEKYKAKGKTALTDGIYGGATFNEGWVGWIDGDAEFIIDLGDVKEIQSVETDFLHQLGAWILLPKSVSAYTSTDKNEFQKLGHTEIAEDRSREVKYVNIPVKSDSKVKARYIKVHIESIGLCPPWHYGVGNPAWFFVDEVNVY